jgi:hypothetical protein
MQAIALTMASEIFSADPEAWLRVGFFLSGCGRATVRGAFRDHACCHRSLFYVAPSLSDC